MLQQFLQFRNGVVVSINQNRYVGADQRLKCFLSKLHVLPIDSVRVIKLGTSFHVLLARGILQLGRVLQ
jgi:hypothetical protein